MSYRYGLNGNDINWEAMEFLNSFIEEVEIAIHDREAEVDEDGNITDEWYQGMMDGNPTWIYYGGKEVNVQNLLDEGKKLIEVVDWFIVHDTNSNLVYLEGDVPDEYLTKDYIKDRDEAEGVR